MGNCLTLGVGNYLTFDSGYKTAINDNFHKLPARSILGHQQGWHSL